jgi:hypothetical protein
LASFIIEYRNFSSALTNRKQMCET